MNSVDITQNAGFLGGSGDFVTVNLDLRRYQPLAPRHTIGVFSLATLQSGEVGTEVPIYRDFHIGGANSIRGWELDGRRGKNQWINTLEYRYDLLPSRSFEVFGFNFYAGLQLAGFTDIGTAWDERGQFTDNFIGGAGFGLRIIVPFVDMIRFDVGFAEDGANPARHFGIREKAFAQRFRVR